MEITPKDKARHLLIGYYDICTNAYMPPSASMVLAKRCAIAAVDEIILAIKPFAGFKPKDVQNHVIYWQSVKIEITKL